MSVQVHWNEGDSLPKHRMMLAAVPGVGNVGKLVLDTMVEHYDSRLLAKIIHPDLPPHATMSSEGLLTPPHLAVHAIEVGGGEIIAITGTGQPMTPRGQHELAEAILKMAKESSEMLLILAGLSADPGDEGIHITCADSSVRDSLQELGINISSEQPAGGMLGLAGLLVSLAPMYGVPSAACMSETIGTSVDIQAADRLAKRISIDFELGLELPIDNTSDTAARLFAMMEGREVAGIDISEDDTPSGFYA
ncbi:MAG: PAC2 family protein [Candidatus Thermoplasmatota archaeon]|nr:PAC2 family protein [Candidatus Thermoplasmatota archaeon]